MRPSSNETELSGMNSNAATSFGQMVTRGDAEHDDRQQRADQSVEQALANKRRADVNVCRTDQLHDRDLAPSRKHRQANRIGDDDAGHAKEQRDDADADASQDFAEL